MPIAGSGCFILTELRDYAKKEGLTIVREFIESKTAKEPGREIFNEMVAGLEQGAAHGIVAWHPDRLCRNSIDGGKLVYLVDIGKILELKFPAFWFDPTPQGKFMLSIAFGQSKYYVYNLSENVKRGIRQKLIVSHKRTRLTKRRTETAQRCQ